MTGGAWLMNPRSPSPGIISLISVVRTILTVSKSLGFLARNVRLTPKRVNYRRSLDIASPSAIVSSDKIQGTPIAGTSLTPERDAMNLILTVSIRTWTDVYPIATYL